MKKCILFTILIMIIALFILFINSNTDASTEKNVLFIGNSKTFYNNLPKKVYNLARLDGNENLSDLNCVSVLESGKSLQWFYEERSTYKSDLLSEKWDYIVLQEKRENALDDSNLSEFKNGAKNIVTYLLNNGVIDENTQIIYHSTLVKARADAESAIYSVKKLKEEQDKTNEHYRIVKDYVEAQTGVKGKVAYSGDNFISCIEDTDMKVSDLYLINNSIGHHPTNAGSYLAACTIYETIFDTKIQDFSGEGTLNPYDNVLDNTYKGKVDEARAGETGIVDDSLRPILQYIARKYCDITPPEIKNVSISTQEWTNKDVTISFEATDNIYMTKVNGQALDSNTYSFNASSNGTYNIETMDLVGHTITVATTISNIDKTYPTDTIPTATSTTNSVTVTMKQIDEASGIDNTKTKYRLTDSEGSTGEWQTSNVFTGLMNNQTYYIQTQVTDNAGNTTVSKVASIKTQAVPDLTSSNTKFEVSNKNWTKDDVTVTVTTTVEGYELQTKVGTDGQWTNVLTQKLTSNNTVYARLTDGTSVGNEVSTQVNNIDKIYPTDTIPTATSTTNSVTVTIKQTDANSGIDNTKTKYRLTNLEGTTGEWKTSNVFTGLTNNQTYYIQTQVTDNAGNTTVSKVASIKTQLVPDLTSSNTKFEVSNKNWTKDDVTVTVTTTVEGYELQTKVGTDGQWTNTSTQKLTSNNTVYARLTDGSNIGNSVSIKVTNIDKEGPTTTPPTVISTTNSITVTMKQIDEASGIDETKTRYRLTNSEGSTGEWKTSNVFTGLTNNQTYYVQTQTTDNVGNTSISEVITAKTNEIPNLTNLNTKFKLSNSNWTNENITVEVEITDKELLEKINKGIYSIETSVESFKAERNSKRDYTQETKRTFESNGRIYVRLTDGINTGTEYFYEITKIDKNAPKILGIDNNSKYSEYVIITDIVDNESGIKEIILEKDNEKIDFVEGESIKGEGIYKITVIDNANNKTIKNFEIVKENKDNNNQDKNDNQNNNNQNNNNQNNNNQDEDKVNNNNNEEKNNVNENNTTNIDNTVADKIIPQTGETKYILLAMIICIPSIIISYRVLKKYKNI